MIEDPYGFAGDGREFLGQLKQLRLWTSWGYTADTRMLRSTGSILMGEPQISPAKRRR